MHASPRKHHRRGQLLLQPIDDAANVTTIRIIIFFIELSPLGPREAVLDWVPSVGPNNSTTSSVMCKCNRGFFSSSPFPFFNARTFIQCYIYLEAGHFDKHPMTGPITSVLRANRIMRNLSFFMRGCAGLILLSLIGQSSAQDRGETTEYSDSATHQVVRDDTEQEPIEAEQSATTDDDVWLISTRHLGFLSLNDEPPFLLKISQYSDSDRKSVV